MYIYMYIITQPRFRVIPHVHTSKHVQVPTRKSACALCCIYFCSFSFTNQNPRGQVSGSPDHRTTWTCITHRCFAYLVRKRQTASKDMIDTHQAYTVCKYTCASSPATFIIFSGLVFSSLKMAMHCFQNGS